MLKAVAWKRVAAIVLPLLLGLLAGVVLVYFGERGPRIAAVAPPVPVIDVYEVRALAYVPRHRTHGQVEAARVWSGIPEVSGRVIESHPSLDAGMILPAQAVLLRIDPVDYELRVTEAEAVLAATRSELERLNAARANARALRRVQEQSLAVARQELSRREQLAAQDALPESAVDEQRMRVLGQEQALQQVRNELRILPHQIEVAQARERQHESLLKQARRNLERTTLRLPFRARIDRVDIETGQFAAAGQPVLVAHGVDAFDVPANLPLSRFAQLVGAAALSQDMQELPDKGLAAWTDLSGLKARVTGYSGDQRQVWKARVDRTESRLDPATRAVRLVVTVSEPRAAEGGLPLLSSMYVEVLLTAPPREPALVIPRASLHADRVYVIDDEGILHRRTVTVGERYEGFVVVSDGLQPGETVAVSDVVPAVDGMAVDPVVDSEHDREFRHMVESMAR